MKFRKGEKPIGHKNLNCPCFRCTGIVWNKKDKITLKCNFCSSSFNVQPHRENAKFCSKNCQNKGMTRGNNKKQYIKKVCTCGKKFSVPPSLNRITYCSISCASKAANRLKNANEQLRLMIKNKIPTSIEKTLYDYLLLKGILFERQKLINDKFYVDAYIPSLNLVIEADGNYWHTLDKTIKKDKAENAYLKKCGFNLIRLTEDEIKSGSFKERMVF